MGLVVTAVMALLLVVVLAEVVGRREGSLVDSKFAQLNCQLWRDREEYRHPCQRWALGPPARAPIPLMAWQVAGARSALVEVHSKPDKS